MGLLPHVTTYSVGAAEQSAVFVGTLLGVAASVALLSHTVVCRGLIGQLWKALTRELQWSDPAMQEEVLKKLRAESLHHACCMNFAIVVWFCINGGIMVANTASGAPRWMTVWQDAVVIWGAFVTVGSQLALRRKQHPLTVNVVYVCFMVLQTAFVSLGPAEQVPFISIAGFSVFVRALWSLACTRLPVVACLTALHFLCACAGFGHTEAPCAEDGGSQNLRLFVVTELVADGGIVLCAVVWRRFCRLRVLHELQASISQSESKAARSLLNLVCDANTELDGELRIVDETPRLASLLQHGADRSLKGSSILQFVVEEDRQLCTERICSASDDCMANVFHMRVRDGINNVLNMEVFHVPVTGYLRAGSHLIGVREHADVREDVGALSGAPVPRRGRRRRGARRASEEAHEENAEPCGPPCPSWSSSSSASSARSAPGGENEIAVWIDVLSYDWTISSFTADFELFWGGGSRTSRISPGARELLEWIKPGERDRLVGWVQASFQEMRALRSAEPAHSPAPRRFENPVNFRPPSLWHVKAKVAYAASIAIVLPEEHQQKIMLARLSFSDIRVVQRSSAVRGL